MGKHASKPALLQSRAIGPAVALLNKLLCALRARLPAAVLGRERRLRIRVQRTLMATSVYVAMSLVQWYRVSQGFVDPRIGGYLVAFVILVSAIFYCAIRSGWSLRFHDPALTMPQMIFGIIATAATYASGGAGRGGLLTLVVLVMIFGAFNFKYRRFVALSLLIVIVFGLVMYTMSRLFPHLYPPDEEKVHFLFIVTVVPFIAILVGQLSELRNRLHRQKIDLREALARIQELATQDELTGLYNRRYLQALLETEMRRSRRTPHRFSISLIDLDRFKRLNDLHGHAAGDEALRIFAGVLRRTLRDTDIAGRWGGEEFLVLLPAISAEEACQAMDRLREALVRSPAWQTQPHLRFTFSAGITEYMPGEKLRYTLERADRALYAAKEAGRDRYLCG